MKKKYQDALKAQNKSLAAELSQQIAETFRSEGNLDEAIEYYRLHQQHISTRGNDKKIAEIYIVLGDIFLEDEDHLGALKEYMSALRTMRALRDLKSVAYCQVRIGKIYLDLGDAEKALEALKEAHHISLKQDLGLHLLSECHRNLYLCYEALNDKEKALEFYKSFVNLEDKLQQLELAQLSSQIEKELQEREQLVSMKEKDYQAKLSATEEEIKRREQTIQQIQEEKKRIEELNALRAREIEYLRRQDEIDRQLLKIKQKQLYYTIGVAVLLSVLGVVLLWAYRQTQRKNALISQQKIELEQANEVIRANNKRIVDSIRYAQKIQNIILSVEHILQNRFKEYFILYRPKDIVSGDFYWFTELPNGSVISVVADCTGHGVPGAFMSLIGAIFLHEIINVEHLYEPSKILEELHKKVRIALKQEDNNNDDGMDMSLCRIDSKNEFGIRRIVFAGAKRSLCIWQENTFIELPAARKTIGGRQRTNENRTFEQTEMILVEGSIIYQFTDGYYDQNNENDEKIGSITLKKWLRELAHLPMQEQREILEKRFLDFKQNQSQRDDVTLVGIKII
ncbi:MAG: SpoIIE family protein phosphatase [Cytophagales bacterium]|nr:SpoIIE family protein phosphatase [Cytophagales bacterium]MDW8383542.1 SpoIIE family protein phosphatase [Flammeovirgaceae bacterium]